MSAISVAAFVPYAPGTTPSQRFRIEQWAPILGERGIEVRLLPFADRALTDLMPRIHALQLKTVTPDER